MRTRTAAKRALSFPLVPVRQLMFCHVASASMSSAAMNVRNVPLTGTAAPSNRPDHLHIGRVHLEVTRNTDRPGKFASCEPLAERRAPPSTGLCRHPGKTDTG